MILRLNPLLPLVWRSPTSIQLGIDPVVVILDDLTERDERMLAALVVGVSDTGLTMMAAGALDERDSLLAALAPALSRAPMAPTSATVAVHGSEALAAAICSALAHSGIDVVTGDDPAALAERSPALAVVAGHYVLAPELHTLWLRRDIPHLPVVVGDAGVTVGPFVEPGSGPCLLCVELRRRDGDAAWPALATQLLGRTSRAESPILVLEGAALASRMVLRRLSAGAGAAASVRIDAATGRRDARAWQQHPECGCRGIAHLLGREEAASPAQPGIDWATAARIAPAEELRTS